MDSLLRQYETWECTGDGYPEAWHRARGAMGTAHLSPDDPGYVSLPAVPMAIKDLIREQAGHRCLRCGHPYRAGDPEISERGEWSPCDEHCTHDSREVRWVDATGTVMGEFLRGGEASIKSDLSYRAVEPSHYEARWRILTVHHLDEDKRNCRWWNLAALCQRCHLRMQRAVVMDRVYSFEHSEWFKPYAAGFYAWKYEQEDLTRAEIMERLDYYLGFEHRFTQEAIF